MAEYRRLGFIGAGNMAEAMLRGLLSTGIVDRADVVVADINEERREYIGREFGVRATESGSAATEQCDLIVLAVKPQQVTYALAEIGDSLGEGKMLVTIAAGRHTSGIEKNIPAGVPVVRAMPNFNALAGRSVTAICAGSNAGRGELDAAARLFQAIGWTTELDEELFNAATAVSGSGPAYFFLFVEALTDAAVRIGLPRETASQMVVETMLGSAVSLQESGRHPADLREAVTSPGGTTAAALEMFERSGFRAAVYEAVEAALRRGAELDERSS